MMYKIIDQNIHKPLTLELACQSLDISRKGLSIWQKRLPPQPDQEEIYIRNEIQKIALKFNNYGYRRITKELQRRKFNVNHKRIRKMMKEDNLLCIKKHFKPKTTNSNHDFKVFPNLAKSIEITKMNQLWVSDITYIRLQNEYVYLAVIIDVYSRRCIGWELSRNIDTQLTMNALHKALHGRRGMNLAGLVHHSDQGVQYASDEYVKKLKLVGILISMSRKAKPTDNAFAESFMKTLKTEEVDLSDYESFIEAYKNIERYIEEIYNEERLHSAIGYLPPNEFEMEEVL